MEGPHTEQPGAVLEEIVIEFQEQVIEQEKLVLEPASPAPSERLVSPEEQFYFSPEIPEENLNVSLRSYNELL